MVVSMAGDEDNLVPFILLADDGNSAIGCLHLVRQPFQGKANTTDDGQIGIHKKSGFGLNTFPSWKMLFQIGGMSGGRKTPFSVISPDTSSRGVASKAGL